MICESRKCGAQIAFVNARISDRSEKNYETFKFFFSKVLANVHVICVQSETDSERFLRISQKLPIQICGNMKFDQNAKEVDSSGIDLSAWFGPGEHLIILAASTHHSEELFVTKAFLKLREKMPEARLVIVPRHAERSNSVAAELKSENISFAIRTDKEKTSAPVDCLLVNTTGEMLKFIDKSDIVIMGKSLAGHSEGHNLIEPAMMGKPIITGGVLSNFRFVLKILLDGDALITVFNFDQLCQAVEKLALNKNMRTELGEKARKIVKQHRGATEKTVNFLEQLISDYTL
jgi:3-deoxy-D-manno-octulosonic-acid transferase